MFLLRTGLAFVFIYAGVSALLDPVAWFGFFPAWLVALAPDALLNTGFSLAEIFLGLWLFSGFFRRTAGFAGALLLAGVTFSNLGAMDIIFRDVGLMFASLALATGV